MSDDELRCYSAALDEVYRLRQALAYEAGVTAAHLGYKSFPKSRRRHAEDQITRMQASARGESERTYAAVSGTSLRYGLKAAGANETLTRADFEAALPRRRSA